VFRFAAGAGRELRTGDAARRNHAAVDWPGDVSRGDRVRRCRQLLTRTKTAECAGAVGARSHLQPARRTGEHTGTKVRRNRENAVDDSNGVVGYRPTDDRRAAAGFINRELQIVGACGRRAAVVQPPLDAKGGTLGEAG
jgi:hypothetical protein